MFKKPCNEGLSKTYVCMYVCMVSIHKELERKVKKLKRMKKEFMQRAIKTEYELPAHGQTTQDQST